MLFRCGFVAAKRNIFPFSLSTPSLFNIARGDLIHSRNEHTDECLVCCSSLSKKKKNPPECVVNCIIFLNFIPSGAPPNLAS